MATTMENSVFSDAGPNFNDLIGDPEIFLQQNSDNHENFKRISKKFYDCIVSCDLATPKYKSLKSLLVDGFDDEQVWQQLEIQNKNVVQLLDKWLPKIATDDTFNDMHDIPSEEEMEQDEEFSENDFIEETEKNEKTSASKDINEEESDFDEMKKEVKKKNKDRKLKYKSKVDDQFFKLSKLEEFLKLEDLKEEKSRDDDEDEESDEEEDIDLFQDISDDDLEDSEDESNKKSSKDYMYEDFFDSPESGDENVKQSDEASDFENEELDSDVNPLPQEEDDESFDDDEEEEEISNNKLKTPFEMEQEKIKEQILEYEESMVTPKPWQLTGEVDVSKRPVDGLLDLPTDFELNAKPIIIQDKEFCEKLENMIKMTIKNKAYSDGVRQEKPVKEIISMKKEIVIDQNKSKKGLAQEYEELYLKKQSKQEEENPKHKEIRKFMDSLFPELYALFSHIPKPAVPDIKIVSNLPAVTVEEVAPTSYSDVTLLAPEEIKRRTGLTKGQTERTETDKNRERRKKKLHQKMKQKKLEKENADGKPLSSKATKKEKLQVLKKLKQHKNTKIASLDGEKIKSSKDFFERLQETISTKVNKGEVKQTKKKKKKA